MRLKRIFAVLLIGLVPTVLQAGPLFQADSILHDIGTLPGYENVGLGYDASGAGMLMTAHMDLGSNNQLDASDRYSVADDPNFLVSEGAWASQQFNGANGRWSDVEEDLRPAFTMSFNEAKSFNNIVIWQNRGYQSGHANTLYKVGVEFIYASDPDTLTEKQYYTLEYQGWSKADGNFTPGSILEVGDQEDVISVRLSLLETWEGKYVDKDGRLTDTYVPGETTYVYTGGDRVGVGAVAFGTDAGVPEPATMLLLATGAAGLLARRKKKRA